MKKWLIMFVALAASLSLQGQRLPAGVVPEHYALTFTPNLKDATFSGEETIDVRVLKPTAIITLNAAEIKFTSATVESHGATLDA
ncbi:MAG: hypothetical protein DMG63_16490, partial [Acidobacteria bacterium]